MKDKSAWKKEDLWRGLWCEAERSDEVWSKSMIARWWSVLYRAHFRCHFSAADVDGKPHFRFGTNILVAGVKYENISMHAWNIVWEAVDCWRLTTGHKVHGRITRQNVERRCSFQALLISLQTAANQICFLADSHEEKKKKRSHITVMEETSTYSPVHLVVCA